MKIKKILLTLWIVWITLFWYSYAIFPNARDCTRIWNWYSYCIFELDIPNEFWYAYAWWREWFILNNVLDWHLNFENNQIILQDNNDVSRNLTFWWNNWKLYWITSYQSSNNIYWQWYIKICESSYSNNWFINDCYYNNPDLSNKYSIDYNNLNLNANFDKYIYINTDYNWRIDWINENWMFCFSDTTNDYSLCFLYYIWNPDYWYQMFSWTNNLISNVQSWTWERYNIFDNSSPFNWWGWNEETTTWWTKFCPPVKVYIDIIYWWNYNTWYCYSNTEQVSWWTIIDVEPIDIFTAFPTYQELINKYTLLSQNCRTETAWNTIEQCTETIQAIWKKQTEILLKINQSQLKTNKIYEYCRMKINYTWDNERNTGICELTEEERYAPWINSWINETPDIIEQISDRVYENQQIIIPEDWTIFDTILPDWIITRKQAFTNIDFFKNLTQIISKIFILRKIRPNVDWILPPVITSLLLLIILFKIYKNKYDKSS